MHINNTTEKPATSLICPMNIDDSVTPQARLFCFVVDENVT
jgi:hypothetical protein